MGNRTPLFDSHVALGAKLVDFGGWDMPVHYGSQLEEHHCVRASAGAFDVSHMTVIEVVGGKGIEFFDRLLANDISRLTRPGQAMYSAMLNELGGVLDDLIVYNTGDPYLVVVNCGTRLKDLAWMREVAQDFNCSIVEREDLAIVAVQGPEAIGLTGPVLSNNQRQIIGELKVFQGAWIDDWFIAKTGYTGERGLEIILPNSAVVEFWQGLMTAGLKPIGLGARDTLRLEAGMNLYGSDMDEGVSPFEANMASTVFLDGRDFIGATALKARESKNKLVGLIMTGKGVLRAHYPVYSADRLVGEITSGAFSPTLAHSIALARVSEVTADMSVEIRGKRLPVECVSSPFVRNGVKVYQSYPE